MSTKSKQKSLTLHIYSLGIFFLAIFLVSCGDNGTSSTTRIINASEVEAGSAPQIVKLSTDGTFKLCTGIAIDADNIITAGHCVNSAKIVNVELTDRSLSTSEITVHPGYFEDSKLGAIFNDIAIIKIPQHGIPAISITSSSELSTEFSATIYGYGIDENNNAGVLKSSETKISSMTPNHIIGASFDGDFGNPCFGDSGAPLILTTDSNSGVIGIVSTGTNSDCSNGDITLYTNLQNPELINFITTLAPGVVFN